MIRIYLRNIIRFVTVILLQVLLFDNIQLNGYLNPYFYVIFIILMPFESPRWLLLFLGFVLGLCIDLFANTPGMHTAATVFMAFIRPFTLKNFSPRDGYEPGTFPRIHYYGLEWFAKYTIFLVISHHFLLFLIETYSLIDIFHTIARTILSTLLTSTIIILSQYFIFRR